MENEKIMNKKTYDRLLGTESLIDLSYEYSNRYLDPPHESELFRLLAVMVKLQAAILNEMRQR